MTEEKEIEKDEVAQKSGGKMGWGQITAWILVISLLGVVGIQLSKSQQGTVAQGDVAPDFIFTTFEGEETALTDLRGKVVVLNFWASWCKPCELEAADLQTAWEMYEPTGEVVFLGVDYIDTDVEAAKYLEKFGITYPNGPDFGTRISQAYRIRGVPETYVINREGVLAFVKIGPFTSLGEITTEIDSVLNQ